MLARAVCLDPHLSLPRSPLSPPRTVSDWRTLAYPYTTLPASPETPPVPTEVVIGERPLTMLEVAAVARHDVRVVLSPTAHVRMAESRAFIDELSSSQRPAYGISTGFGALATTFIDAEKRAQLQRSLVRSHVAGSGPLVYIYIYIYICVCIFIHTGIYMFIFESVYLSYCAHAYLSAFTADHLSFHCDATCYLICKVEREVVRAMMLLRLCTLATGYTGVRPSTAEVYVSMLNGGITPLVHEYGSLGCSGDLAPLAACALAAMGEGMVMDRAGSVVEAGAAMARAGVGPAALEAKEGLALINGTDGMLGMLV